MRINANKLVVMGKWTLLCLFCAVLLLMGNAILHEFLGPRGFVRTLVLVPRSGAYDSLSIQAQGVIEPGDDLATTAIVDVSLTMDGKPFTIEARLPVAFQGEGVLTYVAAEGPQTRTAIDAKGFLEWFRSIGLDVGNPQLISEARNLAQIVPSVACGSKAGDGIDAAVFGVRQDLTAPASAPIRLSKPTTWLFYPIALVSIAVWVIGVYRLINPKTIAPSIQ
jgi:hypothetical protein